MADGEQIERLVVEFDAKTDRILEKLNGLNRSVHGSARQIEKDFSEINIEKAFTKVFDSSRLRILDEGALRLRVFGSALEPLGVLGIGAAAGVAAVGLAIEQAVKAAEYAEQLQKTAKTIGITTTALQEYDFVAISSGISTDEMRKSLQGLNEKIGQVQAGVARGQVKKIFEALDITPEQLRRLGDVSNVLPVIADKLRALPASERDGLAARLDITPILPALLKGSQGIKDLTAQAHAYGIVADRDLIRKSAEAGEKLKVAGDIISKNLTIAFANLAPAIANATLKLSQFLGGLRELTANGKGEQIARLADIYFTGGLGGLLAGKSKPASDKHYPTVGDIQDVFDSHHPAVAALIPDKTKKARGGGRGAKGPNPEDIIKAGADAIAHAQEEELRARQALTGDINARLVIETQLLATATAAKIHDLDIEVAKKKITAADAETAKIAITLGAGEKLRLIQQEAAFKIEDKEIEVHTAKVDALIAQLQDEAAMAGTSDERKKIEKRILEIRQQQERDLLGTRLDRQVITGELTPEQRAQIFGSTVKTQTADMKKAAYDSTYQGVHGALEAAIKGGWPGLAKYMADKLETNLVDALSNALTNALIGGGTGQPNLFSALFAGIIPGYASGTDSAPGGPAIVGENGIEVVNLEKGATVTPNSKLQNLGVTRGMSVSISAPSFDLRGAVVTSDLLAQMNAMAQAAEQRATVNGATLGAQAARSIIPQEMGRRASLQLR